jgi:hypothetical protein
MRKRLRTTQTSVLTALVPGHRTDLGGVGIDWP